MMLQGFPTARTLDGISFVTTLPAPIVVLSPIVVPGNMVTFPPIQTLFPIFTGIRLSKFSFRLFISNG